jgi:hypothetical protein
MVTFHVEPQRVLVGKDKGIIERDNSADLAEKKNLVSVSDH